jgi:hypothetical protein
MTFAGILNVYRVRVMNLSVKITCGVHVCVYDA